MTAPKNGSLSSRALGSGTTSATDRVRRVARLRAAGLGMKPSSAIAAWTFARASGETRWPPLMTRDAVARETPAAAAT